MFYLINALVTGRYSSISLFHCFIFIFFSLDSLSIIYLIDSIREVPMFIIPSNLELFPNSFRNGGLDYVFTFQDVKDAFITRESLAEFQRQAAAGLPSVENEGQVFLVVLIFWVSVCYVYYKTTF